MPKSLVSKSDVRHFWESSPLFAGESSVEPGTREFFEEHERVYHEDVFMRRGIPQSFFPFAPNAKVLDVGCGPGFWTRELARRGYTVSAVDLTAKAVELTRSSLTLFGLSASVEVGDAEQLPFADATFDGVVSHGVIHHTPDTEQCVREIGRVLRPGGVAVVSIYHRNFVLRSPTLTQLVARLLGRFVGLPGRGRSDLLASGDPNEIVRLYDGSGNPLGKAFTAGETRAMFEKAGMTVEKS